MASSDERYERKRQKKSKTRERKSTYGSEERSRKRRRPSGHKKHKREKSQASSSESELDASTAVERGKIAVKALRNILASNDELRKDVREVRVGLLGPV